MPTPTYTPLANITLGSAAATVTFSSIGQGFRDLILVVDGNPSNTSSGYSLGVRFNSSATGYSYIAMSGNGSSTSSVSYGSETEAYPSSLAVSGQFNAVLNIMDYSATDKHKTMLTRFNQPSGNVVASANRWASTAAIDTVLVHFQSNGTNFTAGTTFALYGVAA
jgi:hypothetical protein